jgi:hypothetical protein
MSTATTYPGCPDPDPDDDVGSEVEAWLAARTDGESARVRALRQEVAEAHALRALQADPAPLLLDTPKVRRRRKQGAEAAMLHALANQPALLAWQAARWRRVLTIMAVVALVLALGWSTAGVQVFAAEAHPPWSASWLFAWLVEPFLSLALLTVVAARAFVATRGQPLNDPTLRKIEVLFLGLTLGMNAWPHLPGVTDHFTVSGLVLHILGPIVAVAVVTALPIIWRAFAQLDHHADPLDARVSGVSAVLVARARALIATDQLPVEPSAKRLQKVLRCGMDDARAVRDALRRTA